MTKPSPQSPLDDVWVSVNQNALRENARAVRMFIRSGISDGPRLMAVVKANGYGHGIELAARAFRDGGADYFAVTSLSEALELVDSGFDTHRFPVLVFTPAVTEEQCVLMVRLRLHATICDAGHYELLSRTARALGFPVNAHLKVDTGMSRLGLTPGDAATVAKKISSDTKLNLAGVYTHFATAFEADLAATKKQLKIFNEFCANLNTQGIRGFLRHCANSAALLRIPESRLDIVRAGTVLYGQYPSNTAASVSGLQSDTLALMARAVFVHDLAAGSAIGYGAEAVTKRPTRAAVLPVGFSDGVMMQPASLASGFRGVRSLVAGMLRPQPLRVSFNGFQAPVLGRVGMQMVVVDVTDAELPVRVGDVATVPVRRLAINSRIRRIAQGEAK